MALDDPPAEPAMRHETMKTEGVRDSQFPVKRGRAVIGPYPL